MDVYVDGSQLAEDPTIEEYCQKLLPVESMQRELNRYHKCPRWSWVRSSAGLGPYDYCNKLKDVIRNGGVSKARLRDLEKLVRTLSTGFRVCKAGDVMDKASRTASMACKIGQNNGTVVRVYSGKREVVTISDLNQLSDSAVRRVLYCNHPDVPAYQNNRGYVVAVYTKHSVFPSDFDRRSLRLIGETVNQPSQFLPEYKHGTPGYEKVIREAIFEAMKDGRYSEGRLDGYVCLYAEEVGASNGRMTRCVYLDMNAGSVHIYPKDAEQRS